MFTKHAIRQLIRVRRISRVNLQNSYICNKEHLGRSLTLARNLQIVTEKAKCITCYLPIKGEPDTRYFMTSNKHLKVLLPVIIDRQLYWRIWRNAKEHQGPFGTFHPAGKNLSKHFLDKTDVMLIPAAAVDKRGYRLGWGKGYYDRYLARVKRSIPVFAVVFDNEIFDEIPINDWDKKLTGVVTEKRILYFSRTHKPQVRTRSK
ncbi:MAG: 5-formyltetrahydrofolate cyclo-ligase [Tropheryma whipplei]|nr:5-formyltetrahydrofolate cyclo-ligase [Tropheryma whipplei]